jgi:hypothetical protein
MEVTGFWKALRRFKDAIQAAYQHLTVATSLVVTGQKLATFNLARLLAAKAVCQIWSLAQ